MKLYCSLCLVVLAGVGCAAAPNADIRLGDHNAVVSLDSDVQTQTSRETRSKSSPLVPAEVAAAQVQAADQQASAPQQDTGGRAGPSSDETTASVTPSDKAQGPVQGVNSPEPLPRGTKILHVGDSFAGALGLPLGALLEAAGVKSVLKHTDASYLTDWAWNGELQKYLWKYNPDLLIITLGANELAISEPEQRIKTIRKIVSLVGDRPCLWVGIPLWNESHNALMDVIAANVEPCLYWDSNQLIDAQHMPRIKDGIHPTKEARAAWAAVVFDWLSTHRSEQTGRPWALAPK